MALGKYLFLLSTVLCSGSCVKIFPIDGSAVTLASGFNVNPTPVTPQELTTTPQVNDTAETPILPPQVTPELNTEIPSLEKVQSATNIVATEAYTIIPVTTTIEVTTIAMKIEPEIPEIPEETTQEAIAPTSVVNTPILQTFDIPANDLLPPQKQ